MVIEKDHFTLSKKGTLPMIIAKVPFLRIKEKVLGQRYDLSLVLVSKREAQRINQKYRHKTYVPNTLAFPLTKTSGEIVMCLPAIQSEYKKFDMSYKTYFIYLMIHSMLHLKGYAHGGTMERKEKLLLALFT